MFYCDYLYLVQFHLHLKVMLNYLISDLQVQAVTKVGAGQFSNEVPVNVVGT